VQAYILQQRPDFVVLEEVNAKWIDSLARVGELLPYSRVEPRDDNFGIALFSKFPLVNSETITTGAGIPTLIASIQLPNAEFRLIATHPLPPIGRVYSHQRNQQLSRLADYCQLSTPVILMGDLNTTPWNTHFQRLVKKSGLLDSSVGRGLQPSWPSQNALTRIPIDHFLHSDQVKVHRRSIGPYVGSDHFPLVVEFEIAVRSTDCAEP
jgi:endonuclease/exonuclease/phosphatase (EEP) superfamily protein YafD